MDPGVTDSSDAPGFLAPRVAATPGRTAVVDAATGEVWTYADLDAGVADLAGRLAGVGVDPGDRVPLLLGTSVDAVRTVHAVLRLGATVVPLSPDLASAELARRIEVVGADHLVCGADTEGVALDAIGAAGADSATEGRPVDPVSIDAGGRVPSVDAHDPVALDDPVRAPAETTLVAFTSGTTGPAKAVRLTQRNLRASAVASAFRLGVLPGDRWLCSLPIHHVGGVAPVFRSALYGTAVLVQRGFDPERTAQATCEHDATGVSLVPTMLYRIVEADAELADSLRFVLLGGAAASEDLIAACAERGIPVHPTYGTTETASQIATATPEEAVEHPATVGHPLQGTAVRIVGEDGTERPPGEVGEIVVSGPTVTPGYLDGDGGAFVGGDPRTGGLRTGDLGYRDEAGRLYVVGRADEVVVTGGENVRPGEVEATLREHPAVREAAVVGLDDPEWGERVAALVVLADTEGDPVEAGELRAFCRGRLAGFKTPKTIGIADALPRTASGTVDRAAVRKQLATDGE